MDKKKLEQIAGNPRMIVGVHNYCDRWCERCRLASRCSVFAIEQSETPHPEARDSENAAFWDYLHDIFSATLEMATEWAEKNGVDLDEPMPDDYLALRAQVDEETRQHPLMAAASAYRERVRTWFSQMDEPYKNRAEQAELEYRLELPAAHPEAELAELNEITEVVQWYHTLIVAKLHRATHQTIERELTGEEDITGDANGSAKIALISMDRSLAAWVLMRNHFPDKEEAILDFLVQLERLRRATEKMFPNARVFKRPGFDDAA